MSKRNGRIFAGLGLFAISLSAAQGQSLIDQRIELHPAKDQVGIVSRVYTDAAWIRLPQRVPNAAPVEFLTFSDGGDVVARGVVRFVTPVAPFEAYVTGIRAVKTTHPLGAFKDKFSIGANFGRKEAIGIAPFSDSQAVSLATGMYARVPKDDTVAVDGVEPVRAHINALLAMRTKLASSIGAAASRALKADPLRNIDDPEINVDYSTLSDNLKPFRQVQIEDRIIEKLLGRLFTLGDGQRLYLGARFYRLPAPHRGSEQSTDRNWKLNTQSLKSHFSRRQLLPTPTANAASRQFTYLSTYDFVWINTTVTGEANPYDYVTLEACMAGQYRYGDAETLLDHAAPMFERMLAQQAV